MSTSHPSLKPTVSAAEFTLWAAVTVLGSLFVLPGLGLVLGVVLGLTRLSDRAPAVRWSLAVVGGLLLVIQVVGLMAGGWSSSGVSAPAVVD